MTTEQLLFEIEKRMAWMRHRELQQQGFGLDVQRRIVEDCQTALAKLRQGLSLPPRAASEYTSFSDDDLIYRGPRPTFE